MIDMQKERERKMTDTQTDTQTVIRTDTAETSGLDVSALLISRDGRDNTSFGSSAEEDG